MIYKQEGRTIEGIICSELKGDARYCYAENYLRAKGHTFQKPDTSPKSPDFVIFPFKNEPDKSIYDEHFFAALGRNTLIFSGLRSPYLTQKCRKYNLEYHVMMEDGGVAIKNAVPTSEGVILYLISNRTNTIANSRILVIGYGTCGRDLAKRLKALDADVYALVRSREKECAADSDSVKPIYIDALNAPTDPNFDVIINTVPQQVLTNEHLSKAKGTLLIDIASKPYGFDIEYAKQLNEKSALLPGIPGKYAIQTAGEVLGEYVDYILGRGKQK